MLNVSRLKEIGIGKSISCTETLCGLLQRNDAHINVTERMAR